MQLTLENYVTTMQTSFLVENLPVASYSIRTPCNCSLMWFRKYNYLLQQRNLHNYHEASLLVLSRSEFLHLSALSAFLICLMGSLQANCLAE